MHCSKPILLFSHPSMESLAKAIVTSCEESKLQSFPSDNSLSTTWRQTFLCICLCHQASSSTSVSGRRSVIYKSGGIRWGKFHDGYPNLFIEDVKKVAGQDVIFLASFHSPEVIFEQLSVIYAIPRYLARSFTLLLPYFPTGTMERVDTEGQIATAKTLAQLLSVTPLTSRGPSQIIIFDIHALQERFYFSETVIPRLESAIPLLHKELESLNDYSIAFPDDGAFKRFHTMFNEKVVIVCNKIREGSQRRVRVKDGVAKDRHVVIIDDLVQTGGTLIECAKALMAAGAKCVSTYVTHAVFPNDSWKQFLPKEQRVSGVKFENFWITDSIPHAVEIAKHAPFRMLSLGSVVADMLFSYDLKNC